MALQLLGLALKRTSIIPKCTQMGSVASVYTIGKIGNREIVGYGWNGSPVYLDRVDYPMPAIRFREDTKEIKALREKEKLDWKKLTTDEKKTLYRASFCQTFAEIQAPTGEWKAHLGVALIFCGLGVLIACVMGALVYPELPHTLSEASQKAQLKRMLDLHVNPIDGLSSKWNYETKKWK